MAEIKAPSSTTVRKLFALSMNRCAYPDCQCYVVDPVTHTITAEVCHIRAQSEGGPRYDANQTSQQRHSAENLILLCSMHHKIVDAPENLNRFSPNYLLELKANHEALARDVAVPALSDTLIATLLDSIQTARPTTHMDFRGATLKAGGEGGQWGGGGGAGGVIHIVGVTPAGFHEPIDANGQDGQAPGGGGGGAGQVVYSGRVGDESDIENGLRVSALFIASHLNEQGNGLFGALGGGCAWLQIQIPQPQFCISIQSVFETGKIAPNSILRIDYVISRPDGCAAGESYFDLTVHPNSKKVNRYAAAFFPQFDVDVPGVWKVVLSTGRWSLAEHEFEICAL